jgi:ABC-type transport system involved in cytochrome c biogenesis permease subunit
MSITVDRRPPVRSRAALESPATAVTVVWTATVLVSIFAPDLVTGSEHEHLPLAMMTVWLWASVATAYALMTPQRGSRASWTLSVIAVWSLTAVVCIASPELVTGTDPTRIPLATLVVPPIAAVVTGLLSLRQANRGDVRGEQPRR